MILRNLLFILPAMGAALFLSEQVEALPPSDVTPHELLSPPEHALLYINLVTIIHKELITLQDQVIDEASAAARKDKIEALHSRLNLALTHMSTNPDTRTEILKILSDNPELEMNYTSIQRRYTQSARRCRQTGLINSPYFLRNTAAE